MTFNGLINHKPTLGIGSFFDEAQKNKRDHPSLINALYKICRKIDIKLFTWEFLQCLSCALIQKDKSSYAIVALDFAAKFCCHNSKNIPEEEEDLFLTCVISFVTKVGDGKNTVARLRVCEFINLLLSSMSVEATIDVEIFEIIVQCMLDRAKDKLPTVRVHAFAALQRLQDPQDINCPVTKAFIYSLECDPSVEVRKNILRNIAITQHSLPAIISRSRDYSETVRKEMYQTVAKIKTKRLRIRQRQEILSNGLNETSEYVKDHVIKKLIPTWFENCERDYLKLLKLFYVESFSLETASSLLICLFKRRASADLIDLVKSWQNPDRIIPIDDLSPEKALVWLTVVKYFHNPPNDVKIDKETVSEILPELTFFAHYLKDFSKRIVKNDITIEYIFMRLLDLVLEFSLTDEKGREELKLFCRETLLKDNTESEELVKLFSKLLTFLIPDVSERLETVVMIISDIQHPLEENENSKENSDLIEDSLTEIPDVGNLKIDCTALSDGDCIEFKNIKMVPKCLIMMIDILKAKDICCLHPVLDVFQKTFLVECFKLNNSFISSLTISTMSLLCLLDANLAKENFIKFLFTLENDALELSSLEAIFDQLIFYGLDICHLNIDKTLDTGKSKKKEGSALDFYDDPTINRTSIKHLLNRLSSALFSKVLHIRSVTCQGLAKLLLTNRIKSPFVLAKLAILWFSPELGSDSCVSQPLGIFFDLFAKKVTSASDVILNTLIPALDYLTSKDCDPSFVTVDPLRVANLLLDALKKVPPPEEGCSYHCQAANLICDELLNRQVRSESAMCIVLAKCFYHLDLSKSDKEYSDDLIDKLPIVLKKLEALKEKAIRKIGITFFSKLNTLWGLKASNGNSSVSTNQKISDTLDKDDDSLMRSNSNLDLTRSSNVTIRKKFSRSIVSETIIEEYSGSEDENNGLEDLPEENRYSPDPQRAEVPGTPESEGAESNEEQCSPPTRRKQRKLEFL